MFCEFIKSSMGWSFGVAYIAFSLTLFSKGSGHCAQGYLQIQRQTLLVSSVSRKL